jgi:hypothetical protein
MTPNHDGCVSTTRDALSSIPSPSDGRPSRVAGAAQASAIPAHLAAKVSQRHVQRRAVVYVRQSTPQQMREHGESLARQYGLRQRAEQLGWHPREEGDIHPLSVRERAAFKRRDGEYG